MRIGVVGLGYVGSVAAACLAKVGHDVLGVDRDRQRLQDPPYEPYLNRLLGLYTSKRNLRLLHTSEVSDPLGEVILICTGTPSNVTGLVDLSQVKSAIEWVKTKQTSGTLVMKSTVPPGTGNQIITGLLSDTSFSYVSNPEFLREGTAVHDWFHPDRIVIGTGSKESEYRVRKLYEGIKCPYIITSVTTAEMIKYAANAFLATKISFINEVANLSDVFGVSIDDIQEGIGLDPRIGRSFLNPGVGYGGSCFPKDIRALDNLSDSSGYDFQLLKSVIRVNNRQRYRPLDFLKNQFGNLEGLPICVLGLTFKPGTDDTRESPGVDLASALEGKKADVRKYDPAVQENPGLLASVTGSKALILMTEWPQIVNADWEEIYSRMLPPRLLFDGRNCLNPEEMYNLGFCYRGVGRGGESLYKRSSWIPR